ncbi:MAG: biotin carboxylase, partial [Saprospiraceae bacterium]|nr:biotin carboxylase [Saprospiraceae bacterium]
MLKKVLIANRGEIAIRILRSLKSSGIKSVAVYSSADANAPHVLEADEAVMIGPGPSAESYLLGEKIIQEAKRLGVDGIHPGYGFLSENAAFCEAVTEAGMKFIGPSPHAIRIMGSKLDAKAAVKDYDIPMVPGLDRPVVDAEEATQVAKKIGYPVLIKASAGGGGKGM